MLLYGDNTDILNYGRPTRFIGATSLGAIVIFASSLFSINRHADKIEDAHNKSCSLTKLSGTSCLEHDFFVIKLISHGCENEKSSKKKHLD